MGPLLAKTARSPEVVEDFQKQAGTRGMTPKTDPPKDHFLKEGRKIFLLGDSLIKNIKLYVMKEAFPTSSKVWIFSFQGASVGDMKAYL